MKKFKILVCFLVVLGFLSNKMVAWAEMNTSPVDTFIISINGNALNTTQALNLTVALDNSGLAELPTTVNLKTSGAAQLLSEIKNNVITVLWSGSITDGKATITGKFKPGTVVGNPTLTVTKVEAAGGINITNSVAVVITTLNSQAALATPTPSPSPSASPSPSPSPEPSPSPTPVDENAPLLKVTAPATYTIKPGLNFFKLRVDGIKFKSITDCEVTTSDDSLLRVRPSSFQLSPLRKKRVLLAKIPSSKASDFQEDQEITIFVDCDNDTEAEDTVLITPAKN